MQLAPFTKQKCVCVFACACLCVLSALCAVQCCVCLVCCVVSVAAGKSSLSSAVTALDALQTCTVYKHVDNWRSSLLSDIALQLCCVLFGSDLTTTCAADLQCNNLIVSTLHSVKLCDYKGSSGVVWVLHNTLQFRTQSDSVFMLLLCMHSSASFSATSGVHLR